MVLYDRHQTKFDGIKKMVAIPVAGAIRTTPSKALFTILNWLLSNILANKLPTNIAVRLRATGAWSDDNIGHARILYEINSHLNANYNTPDPIFDTGFTVGILDVIVHCDALRILADAIQTYTDES